MEHRGNHDFSEAFARLKSIYGEDDIGKTRAAAKPAGPLGSIGTANGPIYFLGNVSASELAAVIEATQKARKPAD